VANKREYIERLQLTIQHLHQCAAVHRETMPVHELFQGQTVWQGEVEVFDVANHPKAKRAYAWSHRDGQNDEGERIVTVLEIPPVKSAQTAVQASIMADAKRRTK
jgi:hypothetical protein